MSERITHVACPDMEKLRLAARSAVAASGAPAPGRLSFWHQGRPGHVLDDLTQRVETWTLPEAPGDAWDVALLELRLPGAVEVVGSDQEIRDRDGLWGLSLSGSSSTRCIWPAEAQAANQRGDHLVARVRADQPHLDGRPEPMASWFPVRRWCLPRGDTIPVAMGRVAAPVAAPGDHRTLLRTAHLLCDWLVANVAPSGRTTYMIEPWSGHKADRNNSIRQFMATLSMVRAGRHLARVDVAGAARRALNYNLDRYYRERDGHGTIHLGRSAKLGACALAATCLLEQEGLHGPDHSRLAGLIAGIEALWQPDGAFRTFHHPPDRNDNQNFYPGEALLFLAGLHAVELRPDLLRRILGSIRYHQRWHAQHRNPAFVPWHTQACVAIAGHACRDEMAEYVFRMNDWLLALQQRDAPHDDLDGRFFDPSHPEYGPPHASSTAVYLEGLADAARLARDVGDQGRVARYGEAIDAGLANLLRLQFRDPEELFYVPEATRPLVRGGVRTNPYDSTIRLDNVQHMLTAVLKLLAP